MPLASIRLKCLRLSAALSQGHPLVDRRLVVRKHIASSKALAPRALHPLLAPACKRSPCCGLRTLAGRMSHSQTVTSEFLAADELPPGTHLHLIVLNYILPQQTAQLWHRASTRICADGGANRLYDQIAEMLPGVDPLTARSSFLPDLIKGDLDSVRPDVQDFYTTRGVPMIDLSSDQETTDLEKCLLFLEGRLRSMSEQHRPAAATQQQQQTRRPEVILTVPAADAVARNGVGHGAKAIGALNAARLGPEGMTERSSTSNSSSTVACVSQAITTDKGAAAGSSVSERPAAGACGQHGDGVIGPGCSTPQQQQQLQQQLEPSRPVQRHQQHDTGRQHHHHHNQQQQQQEAGADVAATFQSVSGRIVLLDMLGVETTQQQQQQQQQGAAGLQQSRQQEEVAVAANTERVPHEPVGQIDPPSSSSTPSTPCRSSSSKEGVEAGDRPSSSCSSGAAGPSVGADDGVQQVSAAVLDSCEGLREPPSKRLQQEHVILVLGALGGRLDHTLSNLNTLYCYRHLNLTLWGDGNLVRLLRVGTTRIQPSRAEGPTCGLVPLARPATASSTGLKWNLDNTHMCFRGMLSTSNIIASDTITVSTDEDLLWITAVQDTAALMPTDSLPAAS